MKKHLVTKCTYSKGLIDDQPLYKDVYVLEDNDGRMLWHESLFLCEASMSKSLNTVKAYASDLIQFHNSTSKLGGWRHVTNTTMLGYLHGDLFREKNVESSTLGRNIESLKAFYSWLFEKQYIDSEPLYDWNYKHLYLHKIEDRSALKPKNHTLHSQYIDKTTFDTIKANIVSNNPFIIARDEITLRLGYECGTRAFEVLGIDTNKIYNAINDSRDSNLKIFNTTKFPIVGKGNKERLLFIPPSLCEAIHSYIVRFKLKQKSGKGELICTVRGEPFKNPKQASTAFRNAYKNANLKYVNRQGYHRLRKSYGTNVVNNCYESGRDPWVELPRLLGHSNLSTTKKYIQYDALVHKRSPIMSALSMPSMQVRKIQK